MTLDYKIRKLLYSIKNKILGYIIRMIYNHIELHRSTVFKGFPEIITHKNNSKIYIGKNTIINSQNFGYHINMFAKCKLYVDRPNATIKIGENCRIHGTCIHAYKNIIIGNNCLIAANTNIIDGNGHELLMDKPHLRIESTDEGKSIIIGDNVWIAANCTILGGTIIGDGSVISAGSVVKGVIPPNTIYGGNPAKLIKQY